MPESVHFGLTTAVVKQRFHQLVSQQGSLAKAITSLLNRDKFLTFKYRFRSLAQCEVWDELLRPEVDSLANLSSVLHMLDTYVKFNRLESRSAAIEELLQAIPLEEDGNFDDKLNDAVVSLGEAWSLRNEIAIEKPSVCKATTHRKDCEEPMNTLLPHRPKTDTDVATQTCKSILPITELTSVFCQTDSCSRKDVSAQTELVSFKLSRKAKNQQNVVMKPPLQLDPIRFLAPAIKKIMSPGKSRKKTSAGASEGVVASKRPRKVLPNKKGLNYVASNSCQSSTLSSSSLSVVTVNNPCYSGAPLLNSIAPSQPRSCSDAIAPVQGNVYVYRGQPTGMAMALSPLQTHRRTFVLNPRVVLSPLPVVNSHDIASQSEMFPIGFEQNCNNTLPPSYYAKPCPQNASVSSPTTTIEKAEDSFQKVTASINPSHPLIPPACLSKESSTTTVKQESDVGDEFPIAKVVTPVFQSKPSQTEVFRNHLQQKQCTKMNAVVNVSASGNVGCAARSPSKSDIACNHSSFEVDL